LVVAAVYLGIVGFTDPHRSITQRLGAILFTAAVLCFPLACIWFGDELGDYVGILPGPAISKRSPGWLVKVCGWFLLLLPVILVWFMYKSSAV
jgi:hypothetical protein